MNKRLILTILIVVVVICGGFWLFGKQNKNAISNEETSKKEESEKAKGHEEEHKVDGTEISQAVADNSGIKIETVSNGSVAETVILSGRIILNQNRTAQVKARFPGVVRDIKKGQGETVKVGDALASVESNESLQVYQIDSPINGIIISRNTNIGDIAGETPLFTIADISDVWAEFHIFPRDIDRIKIGQPVRISSFEGQHTGESKINMILPVAEASSQTVIMRSTLQNKQNLWHSGMSVRGEVVINEKQVPLAIKSSAIQRMEGKLAVFVKNGERYEMRPIKIGLSNQEWTEVLEGLKPGESYVSENSFLIKADIGKSSAEHED